MSKSTRPNRFTLNSTPSSSRLATALLFFLFGVNIATWISRIPAIQTDLHLTKSALGSVLLFSALGSLLLTPLWGSWIARYGSPLMTRITILLATADLLGLALAPNAPALAAALFLFGVANGGLNAAVNAQAILLERHYPRPIMSSFHAAFSVGGMSGAALGGLLAARGWTPAQHFLLIALLVAATGWAAIPWFLRESSTDRDTGGPLLVLPHGPLLTLGALAATIMIGEGAMADWIAIYLRDTLHTAESTAALAYSAFSASMAVGRFAGDWLTHHLGPARLSRYLALTAAAGLTLALLTSSLPAAFLGFALTGLGYSVIVPLVFSASGRLPGISPGHGIAAVSTTGFFGFLTGPPLIGFLADATSLRAALFTVAALNLGAAALSKSLERRS